MSVPTSDLIITAVSRMLDDAQSDERRYPSHSDITFCVTQVGLEAKDPKLQGQTVGKYKRTITILTSALNDTPEKCGELVEYLISRIRASGGFRESSPNFVGREAIRNAIEAFDSEGYILGADGTLRPKVLDSLHGKELTDALETYARRARNGAEDAALLTGSSKDLLEATAAHVLMTMYGSYNKNANFPTLLGQAFVALGMATPQHQGGPNDKPSSVMERGMYEAALGVNRLRNKEGTGHGRPWLPGVTDAQARAATELTGSISAYMLEMLRRV